MSIPFLSIIIPAYNEEHRLPSTLEQVYGFLSDQPYSFEILVVENGSLDRTFEVAYAFAEQHAQVKVIKENERGKGLAVRIGMLEAQGDYRFMCDADLSMPITEINRFLPPILTDFDIAIASREAPGAVRYDEPFHRHLGGRALNTIIRLLILPGLHDTQCGFKCFRAPVAEELFLLQTLMGWSFDIEILYLARKKNYRLVEVPIPWYFNPESKLHATRDAIKIILDILRIHVNERKGFYNQEKAERSTTG